MVFLSSASGCGLSLRRPPALPARFSGPLGAAADSVIASTRPAYCAPGWYLDDGTLPSGCVREAGDTTAWVNWVGDGEVVKVVRQWRSPDPVERRRTADRLQRDLAARFGPPVECAPANKLTEREVRWTAGPPNRVSVALEAIDSLPGGSAAPRITLSQTTRAEACGHSSDLPANR